VSHNFTKIYEINDFNIYPLIKSAVVGDAQVVSVDNRTRHELLYVLSFIYLFSCCKYKLNFFKNKQIKGFGGEMDEMDEK
jgi:hypothetical protein